MNLDHYIDELVSLTVQSGEDAQQAATRARDLTREALASDEFRLDCADRILSSIEQAAQSRWRGPPLFQCKQPPLIVRVIFWPPGHSNEPHLHDEWTVTGVLHNEIAVATFGDVPVADDPSAMAPTKQIAARAGDTGYLLPPCVHRLSNPTPAHSATFHVFSAAHQVRDAAKRQAAAAATPSGRFAAPNDDRQIGRVFTMRRRALLVLAAMLGRVRAPAAVALLERLFAMPDTLVRLEVVKALLSHDIDLAHTRSCELASYLRPHDRDALFSLNARLEAARRRQHSAANATAPRS